MPAIKHSKQREAIMAFLKTRYDHPTADTVYMNIRQEFPNISLGTVYRNLTLLNDLGEIRLISVGTGADHFDANAAPHDHFVCRRCQSIIDLPHVSSKDPEALAELGFDGLVEDSCTYYYGVCGKCK